MKKGDFRHEETHHASACGVSAIDGEGQPFNDPEADKALFDTLRANIGSNVELIELDSNVNDDAFALAAAKKLLELMSR